MAKYTNNVTTPKAKSLLDINATPDVGTYISTFLNQINQWAGGSKPKNVGQVSELIKDFRQKHPTGDLDDWKKFHQDLTGEEIEVLQGKGKNKKPVKAHMAGIDQGVQDIMSKLTQVKASLNSVKEKDIRKWLENLTYEKTYCGLEAQEMILDKIATDLGNGYTYKLGSLEDERKGIDGFVIDPNGKKFALQIKSESYRNKNKQEQFKCPIIFYNLSKGGVEFNFDQNTMLNEEYHE